MGSWHWGSGKGLPVLEGQAGGLSFFAGEAKLSLNFWGALCGINGCTKERIKEPKQRK